MRNVKVVDSIMGSGKSSWAIQMINEASPLDKFIYITPFLDEITRVIKGVTNRVMQEPEAKTGSGRKLTSFKRLIDKGADIAATHALFESVDDELIELLNNAGYTLILDEVIEVIERADVTPQDIGDLKQLGHIEVVDSQVNWLSEDYDVRAQYRNVMLLAQAGSLFYFRGSYLIWAFPPNIFKTFSEVYVLTYLFHGQLQRYYFDLYEIPYELKSIASEGGKYVLIDYDRKTERREEVFALINLHEGVLNEVGETAPTSFSSRWLGRLTDEDREQIQRNIYNFFRKYSKTPSKYNLWTTNLKTKPHLSGNGYARGFVVFNKRATNEYRERKALAYCYNVYLNPKFEAPFFQEHYITINQDAYALSMCLQWIWRSRIREGHSIDLYMPSIRMRRLLRQWANYEI